MTDTHPFDQAIALAPQPDGRILGATHPAYANMVGPYGGITAAQALQAVLRHPDLLGEPVALTVNFAGAMADGAFVADARPLRTNRSTQHWLVTLSQPGPDGLAHDQLQVATSATVVTALRRPVYADQEAAAPDVPPPEALPKAHRVGVAWLDRYEMRVVTGDIPRDWDGQQAPSLTRMWVRDDPPRTPCFASLAALADTFFPRIWLRRAQRVAVGTVSMTVYFHADAAQLAAVGEGYLLAQAQGQGFRHGFFDHAGLLWSPAGTLLASTHQTVYYRE